MLGELEVNMELDQYLEMEFEMKTGRQFEMDLQLDLGKSRYSHI